MEKNVKLDAVIIVAVMLVSAMVLIAVAYSVDHLGPSGEPWSESHISITGDNEFASSDAFVSGSGTEQDPYILSIDRIDFSSGVGVAISNTSVHFVLRDSTVAFHDSSRDCFRTAGVGVRIVNATNFVVSRLTLSGCVINVRNCSTFEFSENHKHYLTSTFDDCSAGLVANNIFGGLSIANCTGFVVRANTISTMMMNNCNETDISENFGRNWGLVLRDCARCRVFSNTLNSVSLERGTIDSQISHNLVRNGSQRGGVYLDDAENITVDGNIIEDCSWSAGIELADDVVNCTLVRNNIARCYGGISLRHASGCVIYHNNILSSFWSGGWMLSDPLDCQHHGGGILDEQGWLNSWDSGYPGGGNYYFDYNGSDTCSGPSQDMLGADGMGDTPLIVYTYLTGDPAVDNYPLMTPYAG